MTTEKLFDSDDGGKISEDEEDNGGDFEDGWSSDDCRDMHGPALPPGWDTGEGISKQAKKKKRVSIQLQNNRSKAYTLSVRDLKKRKLKGASQSPQPRVSILKKETEIQKKVGAMLEETSEKKKKKSKKRKRKQNKKSSMQLNTTNQFSVLASGSRDGQQRKN